MDLNDPVRRGSSRVELLQGNSGGSVKLQFSKLSTCKWGIVIFHCSGISLIGVPLMNIPITFGQTFLVSLNKPCMFSGRQVLKKCSVSKLNAPKKFWSKNYTPLPNSCVKNVPPSSWGGHNWLRPSLDRFCTFLNLISCLSSLSFIACINLHRLKY